MLGRAKKANQEPKPKEKKIPGQTVNSTRKRIPIIESEQKVLNLWFKDRQAQAVGPNAAAVDSSSHMVCVWPDFSRAYVGGAWESFNDLFVENHPRRRLVPLEIYH